MRERTASEHHAAVKWSTVADIIPHLATPPVLAHPPTTRTVMDKGRVSLAINGVPVSTSLAWPVGPLTARHDGHWVVLVPDVSSVVARRNDGRASFDHHGRLRLPLAVLTHLSVDIGDEVAIVALPDHHALALCNPLWLLIGAPLSLV